VRGWQRPESHPCLPSAAQRRKDKLPVSKLLLGFFMFVVFGSGASACIRPALDAAPAHSVSALSPALRSPAAGAQQDDVVVVRGYTGWGGREQSMLR